MNANRASCGSSVVVSSNQQQSDTAHISTRLHNSLTCLQEPIISCDFSTAGKRYWFNEGSIHYAQNPLYRFTCRRAIGVYACGLSTQPITGCCQYPKYRQSKR